MEQIRVLLADDQVVMREGLKMLINAQPGLSVCGEASDYESACQQTNETQPDVVVLDLALPGAGGAATANRLQECSQKSRVMGLSAHENWHDVQQFLETGASGYVNKRASAQDLVQAIRTVAVGGKYLDPSVAAHLLENMPRPRNGKSSGNQELTQRECEVARLVAHGYSNKEIAAELDISVKTVETHKSRLMEKLHFRSRAEVVRYAINRGWLRNS